MKRILILALLLTSCGKKTYRLESKVIDSVYLRTEQIKAPLLTDVMVIPEICKDSIATEFKRIYVRDTDTIIIQVKDNQLTFDIKAKERIISDLRHEIIKKDRELKEKKIIEKIAWKPILILSAIIALFIFFPTIPSIIKRIF